MLVETGKKIFYLSPDTGKESGNISTPDKRFIKPSFVLPLLFPELY